MKTYTTTDRQTLFDIALGCYGDVEGILWLMEDNPGLYLGQVPAFGTVLQIRDQVLNVQVIDYLTQGNFLPLTTA